MLVCAAALSALARQPPDPRAVALARQAWQAIEASHAQEALDAFQEAIALDPRNAAHRLGAGLAAHLLGRPADARGFLEQALQMDPGLTPASVLLGILLYRQSDLDGAIRVYEDAAARRPDDLQLTSRLERWRKEAELHDAFRKAIGVNFTVLFEGPAEEALAARALDVLEAAYWRIGTALFTYPADIITVVLYTQEQFRDITRSPGWAAGLYDGRIRVPVRGALKDPQEFERVLTHEFTHALVRNLAPRGVPTWLNEGLAGVFEQGNLGWAEKAVRDAEKLIPLDRLHGSFDGFSGGQATLAYAESALATRFLLDQAGASPVVTLLTDLGNSAEFGEAFAQRTLMSYADFQRSWMAQAK
jgi:tetratricopeptide (TPR) repeat protein